MSKFRERAFLVCQGPDGGLHGGTVVEGDWDRVSMPTQCPANTVAVGVCHSHPPGSSIEPSIPDLEETKEAGLHFVCVVHGDRAKCYPVDRASKST